MGPNHIAYLRVIKGSAKGRVFVLKDLSVFDLGRDSTNTLCLEDESVSGAHARIYRKGEIWTFFDLNSDNGSWINDIPVKKRDLDGGEILRLGGAELHFGFEKPTAKNQPAQEPVPAEQVTSEPNGRAAAEPDEAQQGWSVDFSKVLREAVEMPVSTLPEMRLRVLDGDPRDIGKEALLVRDTECVVGRANAAHLVLNDGKVSRLHCRIESNDGGFLLTDLNSANGTILNGKKISQVRLGAGDYLRIGFTMIVYEAVPIVVA